MEDARLTNRKKQILRAIVDAHITYGEPVGSKYLSQQTSLTCSSATIRNEMADLEQMGYLIQPHTSAGRVPSEQAYRYYVDALVEQYSTTKDEIREINEKLRYKLGEMDALLEEVSRLAASFTDYTGVAFKSGAGNARISRFDSVYLSQKEFLLVMVFGENNVKAKPVRLSFSITEAELRRFTEAINMYLVNQTAESISVSVIMKLEGLMGSVGGMVHPAVKVIYETMSEMDTADIRIDGVNKLLQYPEYSDVDKLRGLLGMFEEKEKLLDVLEEKTSATDKDMHIYIGKESDSDAMSNTTMIFKNVNVGGKKFSLGVIGPRRMNYTKVISMINSLAVGIDRIFNEDAPALPPADEE